MGIELLRTRHSREIKQSTEQERKMIKVSKQVGHKDKPAQVPEDRRKKKDTDHQDLGQSGMK